MLIYLLLKIFFIVIRYVCPVCHKVLMLSFAAIVPSEFIFSLSTNVVYFSVWPIRDVYPVSRIPDPILSIPDSGSSVNKILDPDPHQRILILLPKKLVIWSQNKIRDVHPASRIFILDPGSCL
jgi:hypothetical protein